MAVFNGQSQLPKGMDRHPRGGKEIAKDMDSLRLKYSTTVISYKSLYPLPISLLRPSEDRLRVALTQLEALYLVKLVSTSREDVNP